ncbi:hypothetical protein ARAM_001058 [Aspergillus rambellii]|uniref:C2H2-type domain-containing protein n=1 Tax=Aspergillus rambellii TaxID=308745 RepID=A0A0F8X6F4_9EURO|nr:hypothetical protein ARAM_001058 [Aspergillus rambellii]
MSDEQFHWARLQGYAPAKTGNQNLPHAEENAQLPFQIGSYYEPPSTFQTQRSQNHGLPQYRSPYPQNEAYVRPRDLIQPPLRQWPTPSSFETDTQHQCDDPVPSASSNHQQFLKCPAPSQLALPLYRTGSGELCTVENMDFDHEAKRRRIESLTALSAPAQIAPSAYLQPSSQTHAHGVSYPAAQSVTRTTSQQMAHPSLRTASRPSAPQFTAGLASQSHIPRVSEFVSRPTTQLPTQNLRSVVPSAIQPPRYLGAPSSSSLNAEHTQEPPPNPGLFEPPPSQTSQTPQAPPRPGPYANLALFSFKPKDPPDRAYLKSRTDLIKPIRKEKLAEKLTYDPKTIARDVLIAAGRHPTENPLNHHLLRLRDSFVFVDTNSDLDTFRWDLVDPEPSRDSMLDTTPRMEVGPPIPQAAVQGPPPPPPPPPPAANDSLRIPAPPLPQSHSSEYCTPRQLPLVLKHQQEQPEPEPQPQPDTTRTPKPNMPGRRGRPPGSGKFKVAKLVVPPPATISYPVFACRWGTCQAQLHNLEMLKKHIFKVHVTYHITCSWRSCTFTDALPAAALFNHVKKEHLNSLAWRLGDGPAGPPTVDRDSDGNSVPLTIPESIQPGCEGSLIFPASYSSIRAFNRVHGNHTQYDKAQEIFKAVQRLKEHVGVGLDPGGCELATPSRKERVSNDEEVYEVRTGF